MGSDEQIDWDDLRDGYNRIYKKKHSTVKIFIKNVYKENTSIHRSAEMLGVSHITFLKKMKKLNLPRLIKGHRGKTIFQERYRAIENRESLRYSEIAKIVGCSDGYVYHLEKSVKKWDDKNNGA